MGFDQKDISNYYNNYNSLMKFWYSKIPEFIHTVEYEKLVSDKKNEIEKLLKFCELEWDDNCLIITKILKHQLKQLVYLKLASQFIVHLYILVIIIKII